MNFSDYFYVDESSPSGLRWKVTRYKLSGKCVIAEKDSVAGSQHFRSNGKPKCWQVGLFKKLYSNHRVILELLGFDIQDKIVDHYDRNPFNNKPANLFVKTTTENNRNMTISCRNTSGNTGVVKTVSASGTVRFRAFWHEEGRQKSKTFTTQENALEFRLDKIRYLNDKGYNYAEHHGT